MSEVLLELLSKSHNRKSFDCGREAQNIFLKERARKHSEMNFSKTWVAICNGDPTILGYVTLSMGSVLFEHIDEGLRSKLPRYPMPVLHVGQLATDLKFQGRGVGSVLLRFAAEQAIRAADSVGCFAIELEADNQKAREYYLARGFLEFKVGSSRLYQAVPTLKAALGSLG